MDRVPEGLRTLLNNIRDTAIENNTLYGRSVSRIDPTTPFAEWAAPLLNNTDVMNEFIPELIKRIVYTYVEVQYFDSPLRSLEGDEMPLGGSGQEIYINPVEGRQFNSNDFAGLLCKYESDVKVQYNEVNAHWQYPQTISFDNIRDAFISWDTLYRFIDAQAAAMYNGFYIDDFNTTKGLIGAAYRENMVVTQTITKPTDEASAKAMIRQARAMYLNMQLPSTNYNAWSQVGGAGNPIKTWSRPEDIVILIRNDILALVDVDVLASAFNMDKTNFIGRVYGVDTFDQYDAGGNKIYDGSNIFFAIGDRRWFRIKPQMMRFDQFYNANNTTWQYYLRVEKMYKYSFFANMVVFASEAPSVTLTNIQIEGGQSTTMTAGQTKNFNLTLTPNSATSTITATVTKSGTESTDLTIAFSNNQHVMTVTAASTATGTYIISLNGGDTGTSLSVTVNEAAAGVSTLSDDQPVETAKSTKASK